jgi:hypothetical protein
MISIKNIYKTLLLFTILFSVSCSDQLEELNQNPNAVDPSTANPNLMLPTVLANAAKDYSRLGFGTIGGVAQHMQEDGWYTGYNHYVWTPENWGNWYGALRTNQLIIERSEALGWKFHQGIGLTMRAFIFGTITDLWGDAPYTEALKGGLGASPVTHPKYDSQETIYLGIIEDLKKASALFAERNTTGLTATYDVYYGGNAEKWHRFTNTLLLRYYMRLSEKLPQVARQGIESVYQSGVFIQSAADDAKHGWLGTDANNSWPTAGGFTSDDSGFRRRKPCSTLLDVLLVNNDPRTKVWFQPVYCRWVADPSLTYPVDEFIRRNGVLTNIVSLTDVQYRAEIAAGNTFTRRYNPNTFTTQVNTNEYVGVPAGLQTPDGYNYNPTPGQTVENQHVSQLAPVFRDRNGNLLAMRLASASETAFILAEAAQKGWNVGNAATHYNRGVQESLNAWGVGNAYSAYIAEPGVAYNNTLERIIQQKWIAGFAAATESWFDFRRTGLPALEAGPASAVPHLPLKFIYGQNEINNNATNLEEALSKVQPYNATQGENSQWSKPWLVQGTTKPW